MPYTLSEVVVLFFTYSVVGWLWETFYCSIKDRHFAYRGFLFGPYCPVYGFAVTTILISTYEVQNNLIMLFIVGLVVSTIFEYVASLFLEKTFHMKLWDYSHLWGNLQGRVAPVISLFWGIGVVVLVRFIQPFIQRVINLEEMRTHGFLALIVAVAMGTDTVLTIISVEHFHTTTQMWEKRVVAFQERLRGRIEQALPEEKPVLVQRLHSWRTDFLEHLEDRPAYHLSWNQRRFVKSFPQMKMLDAKRFNKIKEDLLNKQ